MADGGVRGEEGRRTSVRWWGGVRGGGGVDQCASGLGGEHRADSVLIPEAAPLDERRHPRSHHRRHAGRRPGQHRRGAPDVDVRPWQRQDPLLGVDGLRDRRESHPQRCLIDQAGDDGLGALKVHRDECRRLPRRVLRRRRHEPVRVTMASLAPPYSLHAAY
jgi:hypothetical protein